MITGRRKMLSESRSRINNLCLLTRAIGTPTEL